RRRPGQPLPAPTPTPTPSPDPPHRGEVIGHGDWGPNLVRNFADLPDAQVWAVSDTRPELLAQAHARYPANPVTTESGALIHDPAIDAVVIMTPVSTHFELAMEALRADKHVLVAKPIATSAEQAAQLIDEAERRHLVLMV